VTTVHVIGDSHANLFAGRDGFQVHYLGAVLAYSLCESGAKSRGREKFFGVLAALPKSSTVLLCFGEIDCRVMLGRRRLYPGKSVEEVVKVCADRYCRVLDEVAGMGFKVLVYNVEPPAPGGEKLRGTYPSEGTHEERTFVASVFNSEVAAHCKTMANLVFVDLWAKLRDAEGKIPDRYFVDAAHLSKQAFPIVNEVVTGALRKGLGHE